MPTVAVRSQVSKLSFKGHVGIRWQDLGLRWYASVKKGRVARRRPRGHRFKVNARQGRNSREKTMGNVAVQKKQTGETPSVAHAVWDPFWFMREMFGWGRSA